MGSNPTLSFYPATINYRVADDLSEIKGSVREK